jgi:hypothetical protein
MKTPSNQTAFESAPDKCNFNTYDKLKVRFLNGEKVSLIDYDKAERAEALGAIKTLQDELPIVTGWRTIRQSHLSETRTRARCYHIPEIFLREGE